MSCQYYIVSQYKRFVCFREFTPVLSLKAKRGGGVASILIFLPGRLQPYHSKGLGESFPLMRLNIGPS